MSEIRWPVGDTLSTEEDELRKEVNTGKSRQSMQQEVCIAQATVGSTLLFSKIKT
jgi:hypothetical protein